MIWAQADDLLETARNHWVLIAIVAGVLVAGLVLLRIAAGRKKEHPDLERGLRENLAEYPPPPPAGKLRLTVNGVPARLRLVVVAPTGKHHDSLSLDQLPELLDDVVRGLGGFVVADKPRLRVWPPQLSVAGFAPTFHRLVASPDPAAQKSRWVRVAGPARPGNRPVLIGLAVLTDEPVKFGELPVEGTEWGRVLRVES